MVSVDTCFGCFMLAFILSPLILQGSGMFGSSWVPDETCDTIDPKLDCCRIERQLSPYYSNDSECYAPFYLRELDATAYGFQAVAFSILLLPIIFGFFEICFQKDDDDDVGCFGVLGGLCFLLYPLAGLLSFIGCMIIAVKFSGSKFGTAFYLCLSSGLYVLAITGILIFYICNKKRRKARRGSSNNTAITSYPSADAAAPYDSGPVGVQIQAVNIEHRAVVHDPETGGFRVFMKSVNIFHMVMHRE